MNNKQLAEMIKHLRKKKLEEVIGKPGKFDPEHADTHPSDPTSPNQYIHRKPKTVEEDVMQRPSLGPKRARRKSVYKSTLGALEKRRWGGNQSQRGRYTEEEVENLGTTDTGKKSKIDTETVDINPKDTTASAKGEMNKNLTVKETKEK